MSLWQLVNVSAQVEVLSGDLTLTEPAGVQAGDLLVACISYRSNAAFTEPTGWTNTDSENTGNVTVNATGSIASAHMSHIVRGGSAPSLVWTRTAGDLARGAILAYRRTDGGTPAFDQASSSTLASASTTGSTTGITTVEEDTLLIMLEAGASNVTCSNARATDPAQADWAEHTDAGSTNGADGRLAISSATKVTAGATGTFQWTASASRRHATIVGAFRAKYNVKAGHGSFALTGQSTINPGVSGDYLGNTDEPNFNGSNTKTFTSVNLAAAAADRLIFVNVGYGGAGLGADGGAVTSVTIGGETATKSAAAADPDDILRAEWWWALVPSGTTGNIVLTFANTETAGNIINLEVYRVIGADTSNPVLDTLTDADNVSHTLSGDIDQVAEGVILASRMGGIAGSGTPSAAWTGANEDSDLVIGGTMLRSSASFWQAADELARAISVVGTFAVTLAFNCCLAAVSIQPPAVSDDPVLDADHGSYALSGQAAGLRAVRQLLAGQGSYALAGQTVSLERGLEVEAQFGNFALAGQSVNFISGRGVIAEQGAYSLTGQSVDFTVARPASGGLYTYSGRSVDLLWSGAPIPPDFTPAGGGGGIEPPDYGRRFRIRKDKTKPYEIRVGEWPTEAQLQELKEAQIRAEQRELSQFIASLPQEENYEDVDEEEQALMLILSLAA